MTAHSARNQLPCRPLLECLSAFDPFYQLLSLYLRPLIFVLDFLFDSIDEVPLLLLDGDKTLLQLFSTEDDSKGNLVPFSSRELCGEFRFDFEQVVTLRHY